MGCARSGTTILSLMLHAHPKISMPTGENNFVIPLYRERSDYDLTTTSGRQAIAARLTTKTRWFEVNGVDAKQVRRDVVSSGTTIGTVLGIVLRAYADQFGKVRWGDKRPIYHGHVPKILRMFPDAQFINIVRDGRDVVASMESVGPWKSMSMGARAYGWVEAVDNASWLQKNLRPDTYFEVQYEHLVADPTRILGPLCEFLGEDFDEAMLAPQEVAEKIVPRQRHWHARTHEEVSSATVGRFAERLKPRDIALCEAVMGEKLTSYGYALTGAPAPETADLEEYDRAVRARDDKIRADREADRATVDHQLLADLAGVEVLNRRTRDLDRRVKKSKDQARTAETRLNSVLESRSWRWSRPLRAVSGASRRIGR